MGKAVIVSDVGSFREYPDEICLKAPVDASEEEHIFEYLNLLVSRPEFAVNLGCQARAWVERECNWEAVARKYMSFLEGRSETEQDLILRPVDNPPEPTLAAQVPPEQITDWAPVEDGSRNYVETHLTRLQKTLAITPPAVEGDRILEMGAYLQITPALKNHLGYTEVRGCYYGSAGKTDHRRVTSESGEEFECTIDLFDAEKDCFPYADGHFGTVLCCELLEHLTTDPMHMMGEINRVLRTGGHLVLTTPNVASLRALAAILQGFHPQLFSAYIQPRNGVVDARHAREYTPSEIRQLLESSGFEVTLLETGPFRDEPKPEYAWVEHLLERYMLTQEHRGEGIYAVGRKTGPVRQRYPAWLYS
jgi:SAM-dependent methyltransferase